MKKKIFYWSPCLNPVGTVISTINSSIALEKYSDLYEVSVINTCGEWNEFKFYLKKKNVNVIDLSFKFYNYLPKTGFIKSRLSYTLIFLISFIPLVILLKKEKPKFLVAHLITSLPIFIFNLFKFETELILRISGMPKLNFIRKTFWKFCSSKIKFITCPTIELKKKIEEYRIFENYKIFFLPDAVINAENFRAQIKTQNEYKDIFSKKKKILLAVGRLTKQKNFDYLIEEFSKFYHANYKNYCLVIFGDGEELDNLKLLIKKKNLTEAIFLLGRVNNIFRYMKDADALVLSSRWEEMGFVIIESAFANLYLISSNCPNGPSEFLNYGKNGILYENDQNDALLKSLIKFDKLNQEIKKIDCLEIKKNSMKFSMFRHFKILIKILSQ